MFFQIMPTWTNLESQSQVSKVLLWATAKNMCLCTSTRHTKEYLIVTAYMKNIVSQVHKVSFQNHSEHSTAMLPLIFNQPSYVLLPALIYGPTSLLRGLQRLYFLSPDSVVLLGQTLNMITAVSTHNIDKNVSVDTRRQCNSPQFYTLMKDMLYRLELPPHLSTHHLHQLQIVDVSQH